MTSETNLEEMFQKWNDLNLNVSVSMGSFDFDSIKEIRNEQRKIEDAIYSILLENAPDDIKKILPEDCGEFEIGYNVSDKIFYFLTYDPEESDESDQIMAITFDLNKNVNKIKNFQMHDYE